MEGSSSSTAQDAGDLEKKELEHPSDEKVRMEGSSSSTAQDAGDQHKKELEHPSDEEVMMEGSSSSTAQDAAAGNQKRKELELPSDEKDGRGESSNRVAPDTGGAENIEGFDRQLVDEFKSEFRPLSVRDKATTIYSIPHQLYMVKPEFYRFRYRYFGFVSNFEMFYPRSSLHGHHMLAHMHSILSRNSKITFEDYLSAFDKIKGRIRQCHLFKNNVDFKAVIGMVMSCGHILDVQLLSFEGRLVPQVDQACSAAIHELCMDMLLLEGQVPFFALQTMYEMLDLDKSLYPNLVDLCLYFFREFLEFNKQVDPMPSDKVHHLLHLVHYHLLPSNSSHAGPKQLFLAKMKHWLGLQQRQLPASYSSSSRPHTITPIPSARRLQDAGIKFKKKKTNGFSNIIFRRGVLEIPYLRVDKYTEILLRNLMAWEQCHPNVGVFFTSYGIFMDFIINKAEDVEILNRYGILEQTLGSEEEVAYIFNGLSTNIFYIEDINDFLPSVCNELNRYCQDKFNLWKANLMNDYFGSPWAIISVIAAIFLLILTSVQTFFSAYAYFRPP